jgi:DNA-binding winged helix-turn-helix (wHTH) protein/ketosteroid isomerase-like protein
MRPAVVDSGYVDFGCFGLNLDSRVLIDRSGRDVALRRREFDLLSALARCSGRVMSRAALLDAIAGREAEPFDRTIDVYVGRLRQKIETDPKRPRLIVTVPGIGYRLTAKPKVAGTPSQADSNLCCNERIISDGLGILTAFNQANAERDERAISSLYAKDAISIRSDGPLSGRRAIARTYARNYRDYSPHPSTLDHVTAIGDCIMLRAGGWSGIYQGQDGPVHLRGSWTTTDMRDGDIWKIRTETVLMHSGSFGTTVLSSGSARRP